METSSMMPTLHHVGDLAVEVAAPLAIGETPQGLRRMVPIIGGQVSGPRLSGRVLPGGGDYQLLRSDGTMLLEARYLIELDDGALVHVDNRAIRRGSAEAMARIAADLPVDPAEIYCRSSPVFETGAPQWRWLVDSIFVARIVRQPERVMISVFEVQ
ncbi:DUF3237 domain-containing protein [Phytohalomonas tamaricis]|uniref:DUF3237 domain-containing protein n=1 Tax=Phytohalomonas tamaricis TaxID=2081032 RepID=UPI000D0AC68A|nr:DUF3237 domain-containing protein [Phytohalomonas tamaricis]